MAAIPKSEDVTKVLNKNLRDQKPRKYPFAGFNRPCMRFYRREDEPNIFLYSGNTAVKVVSTGSRGWEGRGGERRGGEGR